MFTFFEGFAADSVRHSGVYALRRISRVCLSCLTHVAVFRRLWGAAAGPEAEEKLAAEDDEFKQWKKKYDGSRRTYTRTGEGR